MGTHTHATALRPMHRVWMRCSPREGSLQKRKRFSSVGGEGDAGDGVGELGEQHPCWEKAFYSPVVFYLIRLTRHERALLLGLVGAPLNLGPCGICGMTCCDYARDRPQALQVAARMQYPMRRPEQFEEIGGVDLEYQSLWATTVKRDFAWCGVFDRVWNFGYEREQLTRMFTSMPPQMRHATQALTVGVQRLIQAKKRIASQARPFQDSEGGGSGPLQSQNDPVCLTQIFRESEDSVASPDSDGSSDAPQASR
jgi:hypothetical protein